MPRRSLAAVAFASLTGLACTPTRGFPLPSLADAPCPPLVAVSRPPPRAVLAPHPIPTKVVALLSPDAGISAESRTLHRAIADALEQRGFSTRTLTLDQADESSPRACTDAIDVAPCLEAIATWLAQRPESTTDLLLYARYAPGRPTIATFVVHDIARGEIVLTRSAMLAEGDLVVPLVLPSGLAYALADHVAPPPPITDEERWILETLDEPPYRAADQFCER